MSKKMSAPPSVISTAVQFGVAIYESYFDIPLDALRSAALDNLFGAGRVVSSDAIAFAAVRVMGTCFATGQAAGVAAAFQAKKNDCPLAEVQQELRRQGALV